MKRKTFEEHRALFGKFYEAVKRAHLESKRSHHGHGLDHDVTAAQIGDLIAPDGRTAEKAWCALMTHSVDRMTEKRLPHDEEEFAGRVAEKTWGLLDHLPPGHFTPRETKEIFQASFGHFLEEEKGDIFLPSAGRKKKICRETRSPLQQIVLEADWLANLMPAVVIRAGQFLPGIPAFEFEFLHGERNPASTYHGPRSVLDDLRANLRVYVPMLRTRRAKKLAKWYAASLQAFVRAVEKSNRQLGLVGVKL